MLDRTAPIESYLREAGMDADDAHQWASYIQQITSNRYFHSGHPLTLYKDPETGEMRGLKYDLDQNNTVIGASLGAGVLKAAIRPIDYYIRPIKMTFAVKDNFQRAAAENGIPKPIVESLQDAFSDRHDLNRLAPGSAVKLIYQEKVSRDGSYTLVGDVQAAQIRFGSRTLTAISFSDEHGRPHLYDEQGHALGPQSLTIPAQFPVHILGLHVPSMASDPARVPPACRRRSGRQVRRAGQIRRRRHRHKRGMAGRTRQLHPHPASASDGQHLWSSVED